MASFWYNNALANLLKALQDMDGHDIRVALLSTNTTADTEKDKVTVSGFTTLDEFNGANYARKALASEAVNTDNVNNRGEFDADDLTNALGNAWENLGAGTRDVQGMLILRHITNDSDNVPIMWCDTGGFPFNGNGGRVEVTWNAEGIGQLQG